MIQLYHLFIYQPLFNLLVFFYNTVSFQDIGIAVVLMTIFIKLILYPLSVKSIKAQKSLQDLQPKVDALKAKYKGNQEIMGRELMALYKTEKISPASSCLPLLIQLPFLIAVYNVFRDGLKPESLSALYSFVYNPGQINAIAFGFLDFSAKSIPLAALSALAQYWASSMLITKRQPKVAGAKDENLTSALNKQTLYFMPIFTFVIGISLPAGLTFYWFLSTLLTALQQLYVFKKHFPKNQTVVVPTDSLPAKIKEIKNNDTNQQKLN
ncbi:MAG TPA: YidC/Oxa1 family membrane protein insertase [Patescibacteria group bacterium]|nr:YidC/Oxa1 family membrane protein insertase [Patescibacteria group bacterium]